MVDLGTLRNRVILFEDSLWTVNDIRGERILMSKLESDADIEEFDVAVFDIMDFDFEQARLDAVDIMNQTRYYDNSLSKEKDNTVL